MTSTYVPDNAWVDERERLASIEVAYDAATARALTTLGISAGWRCLEVGAGGGTVAQWLADRVGPTGLVVATDIDVEYLEPLGSPNLSVLRHDVTAESLPGSGFDVAHARMLLAQLDDPAAVVATLCEAIRPGGWVVVEDLDWVSACSAEGSPLFERVAEATRTALTEAGSDPAFGRRLPGLLAAAGLAEVNAIGAASMDARAGRPAWLMLLARIHSRLLRLGISEDDLVAFRAELADPHRFRISPLMVTAYGRRRADLPVPRPDAA